MELFFWLDLSSPPPLQGMSPGLAHCWALLASCFVEVHLPAALWSVEKLGMVLVNGSGEGHVLSGRSAGFQVCWLSFLLNPSHI